MDQQHRATPIPPPPPVLQVPLTDDPPAMPLPCMSMAMTPSQVDFVKEATKVAPALPWKVGLTTAVATAIEYGFKLAMYLNGPGLKTVKVGDLEIDTSSQRVNRGDARLSLTRREYDLLLYMATHPNRLLTRTMIGDAVWQEALSMAVSNVIDVYVSMLRRKLDKPFAGSKPPLIHTVVGCGYYFGETPPSVTTQLSKPADPAPTPPTQAA